MEELSLVALVGRAENPAEPAYRDSEYMARPASGATSKGRERRSEEDMFANPAEPESDADEEVSIS